MCVCVCVCVCIYIYMCVCMYKQTHLMNKSDKTSRNVSPIYFLTILNNF